MQPCDSCISSNEKSRKIYLCSFKISEKRIATAIVSQKIDFKNVFRKSVARSRKKEIGSPEKEVRASSQNNVFVNPNESLATSSRITEGIQRLPAQMVTVPDEFIGGLFQGMLNAGAAAPPHDLLQVFNRELNNLNDETVLTVLSKCDARVSVCHGCSFNFKRNEEGQLPPFDFIIVKKFKREYFNPGRKCLAAYFHAFCDNRFYQPFECIHLKYLIMQI